MKNLLKLIPVFLLSILIIPTVNAQDESTTVDVNATVTTSLTITTTAVEFGSITANTSPNLAANGNDAVSVDVGNGASPGRILLSDGVIGAEVIATFTTATLSDGGSNSMTFTPDIWVGGDQVTSGTTVIKFQDVSSDGQITLDIGGSLGVDASQANGVYSTNLTGGSDLSVSFVYQ